MSEIINILTPDMVGKKVTCYITGKYILDAKIQFENDKYYICQNVLDGCRCIDKLGYTYSWQLDEGVTDLKVVEESVENNIAISSLDKKIQRLKEGDKYLQPVETNILKSSHDMCYCNIDRGSLCINEYIPHSTTEYTVPDKYIDLTPQFGRSVR